MKRMLQTLLGITLLATFAAATTDSMTFTNNSGKDANDLHIEWSRGVKVTKNDAFTKFNDKENSRTDFSKGDVAAGESCEVTFEYEGTDPAVKSFYWTKDGKNIGNGDLKKDIATVSVDHIGDIVVTTLTTSAGSIRTYLPEDIRAGDTITGTVIMTPDPTNEDAEATLKGTVIQVGDKKATIQGNTLIAAVGTAAITQISFSHHSHTMGKCELPINTGPVLPIDPAKTLIGQTGHPLSIPFNGDPTKPITATLGETQVPVLAGTPRNLILGTPKGITGATEVGIECDGDMKTIKVVMLELNLSAAKTTLMKGEETSLRIKVRGLDGLGEDQYPVNIQLINETPSVVQLDGSATDSHMIEIHQSDVGTDGTAMLSVPIKATESGGYKVTGNIAAEKCGATRSILKIEKLDKGGNKKDGFTVIVRRDTWVGTCTLKKGHKGEHSYDWKLDKQGVEEKTTFKTKDERDTYYKSLQEAKAKIDKEISN